MDYLCNKRVNKVQKIVEDFSSLSLQLQPNQILYRLKHINENGFMYKPGIFSILKESYSSSIKSVECIQNLYLKDEELIFEIIKGDIVKYYKHMHCLDVQLFHELAYLKYENLLLKQPLPASATDVIYHVQPRYHHYALL